jgi:hypothetical protein
VTNLYQFETGPLMKKLIAGAIAVAVLWTIWPYYALYELANSLNQADPIGLERRIDWSSVRQGFREDLNTLVSRSVQEITEQGLPGAAFGAGVAAMIGPALIRKTLDAVATPQTVAALITRGKMNGPSIRAIGSSVSETSNKETLHLGMLKYAFFSQDPFTFKVAVVPSANTSEAPLILLLKWNGDWRLTRIVASRKTIEAIAWGSEQPRRPPAPIGSAWLTRLN